MLVGELGLVLVPDDLELLGGPEAMPEVLKRSDYLALTLPLTEETRGLLGARELDDERRSGPGRAADGDLAVVQIAQMGDDRLVELGTRGHARGAPPLSPAPGCRACSTYG